MIKKHDIKMNRESCLATIVIYAKDKLEEGLPKQAIAALLPIKPSDKDVFTVKDSQELDGEAANLFGEFGDANEVPEFNPECPFAMHVPNIKESSHDLDFLYVHVFCTSDYIQALLENGESRQDELLALCTSFLKVHVDDYVYLMPVQPRSTIKYLNVCMRIIGALLDPRPFAFDATFKDFETLDRHDPNAGEENPITVYGTIMAENTFWKTKRAEYTKAQFEEATHGASYNKVLFQLALEPNRGTVDMLEELKVGVKLLPTVANEFRGNCGKILEAAIVKSFIKVVYVDLLRGEHNDEDIASIPTQLSTTDDPDVLLIVAEMASVATSCRKIFSTKAAVTFEPYSVFVHKLNIQFAQKRALHAMTNNVCGFASTHLTEATGGANPPTESQLTLASAGATDGQTSSKQVAEYDASLKAGSVDANVCEDLVLMAKDVALCNGADVSTDAPAAFKLLGQIMRAVIERISDPSCGEAAAFSAALQECAKVAGDNVIAGGFKSWCNGSAVVISLRSALGAFNALGDTCADRFKNDTDHNLEKALRRSIASNSSKDALPSEHASLQSVVDSLVSDAKDASKIAEDYGMEFACTRITEKVKELEKLNSLALRVSSLINTTMNNNEFKSMFRATAPPI